MVKRVGYPEIHQAIRQYFKCDVNPGDVSDFTIAHALSNANYEVHGEIIEAAVHWMVKFSAKIDITSLGTQVDYKQKIYRIQTDLGISDYAKMARLWRSKSASDTNPWVAIYDPRANSQTHSDLGNYEYWAETTLNDANGDPEPAIALINSDSWAADYRLMLEYWFYPPQVEESFFYQQDANGDLVKRPPFPRICWPAIEMLAKIEIAEVTGDLQRRAFLRDRYYSPGGGRDKLVSFLAAAQTGLPIHVDDETEERII